MLGLAGLGLFNPSDGICRSSAFEEGLAGVAHLGFELLRFVNPTGVAPLGWEGVWGLTGVLAVVCGFQVKGGDGSESVEEFAAADFGEFELGGEADLAVAIEEGYFLDLSEVSVEGFVLLGVAGEGVGDGDFHWVALIIAHRVLRGDIGGV